MSGRDEKEPKPSVDGPPLFGDAEDKTGEARKTFQEISECTYSSSQIGSSGQNEHMTCDCTEEWDSATKKNLACGPHSDCINRVTSVECMNKFCYCGKDCQNQRFQKKEYARVSVFQTEMKGYGLRADRDIKDAAFIYEYIGEVIDENIFRKRMVDYDNKNYKHFYFMMLKKDSFIDATVKGSLARFCNHSCNPNAFVDKWVVGDKLRMGIFAKRDIIKGEEITFDYNVDRYGAQKQPCYCGEPNCIKWLGGKTQTDAALLLPEGISEALGVTGKQEKQWLKENKHLRTKQQDNDSTINEAFVKSIQVSPLEEADVSKVMGALMKTQDLHITQKLVDRIYLTTDDNINLSIIRIHGYKTFSQIIRAFASEDSELVRKILVVLSKWPKVTRNKISSSQVEDVVRDINAKSEDGNLKELSSNLLEEWSKLHMAYRIPKNTSNGETTGPNFYSRSGRSESRSRSPSRSTSLEPQTTEGDSTLPEGWNTAYDPNTGRNYYYHTELGISRWDRPTKEVPKGPKGPRNNDSHKKSNNGGFSEGARREEERLKREKQIQFKEVQQKEKQLQDLILQSQKEAEEKKALERELKEEKLEKQKKKRAEKHKHKEHKSQSDKKSSTHSSKPSPDKIANSWTKLFAQHVPNFLKKYESEIGREHVKGCAKEIVQTLVSKEMKKDEPVKAPKELDNSKLKKIKEYSRVFMEKFLNKFREKQQKKRASGETHYSSNETNKKHKSEATETTDVSL